RFVRTLDAQGLATVPRHFGHVSQVDDLLEVDLVDLAGELVHPHLAVSRPGVDQGHHPAAVADQDLARLAEHGRHQDGEGNLAAGLGQRHSLLARQGGAASRGPTLARARARALALALALAELDAVEPEHVADRGPPLW